ncbi:hypothetical protein LPY66_10260 [Dehalobacter sp. DCM]|uniref:hypothetical protein n=1 Tax=Dehalobacter sp. DCM TaxID=2907827 RepID=UPI0030816D82|nr:hypothetical protein LPY66_10260 [Dehalobacter sp. DCM]
MPKPLGILNVVAPCHPWHSDSWPSMARNRWHILVLRISACSTLLALDVRSSICVSPPPQTVLDGKNNKAYPDPQLMGVK